MAAFVSGWPDQVQVLYVSPGSPAEAAGLVESDLIQTAYGGRAAFVIVEMIRGRRVDPKRERLVHAAGMVVLLAMLVVLTVRDVVDPLL